MAQNVLNDAHHKFEGSNSINAQPGSRDKNALDCDPSEVKRVRMGFGSAAGRNDRAQSPNTPCWAAETPERQEISPNADPGGPAVVRIVRSFGIGPLIHSRK
ncbi:hypothetical protein [Nocardia sp. NPDC004123]